MTGVEERPSAQAVWWTARQARARMAAGELSPAEYASALASQLPVARRLGALSGDDERWLTGEVDASAPGPASFGSSGGALAGVVVAIKDVFDVAGQVTAAGTAGLAGNRRAGTAGAVRALRSAGAVIGPRTALHELSFGVTGLNAYAGPCRLPADPDRIAGGSSGGSAVAVAVGLTPVALGADTGGSVRIPAAWCGVVGFRPTPGRYPGDGMVPVSPSRDTAGIMARSVSDVALVDAVLASSGPLPLSRPSPSASRDPARLAGVRLGLADCFVGQLDPGVVAVFDRALDRLSDAGAELVPVAMADLVAAADRAGLTICLSEFLPALTSYLDAEERSPIALPEIREQVAGPDLRRTWRACERAVTKPQEYASAVAAREAARLAYEQVLAAAGVTALVHPTCPVPPPTIEDCRAKLAADPPDDLYWVIARNANFAGAVGLPAISLPAGAVAAQGSGGPGTRCLPVGLELCGRRGDDDRLLRLAYDLADVLPQ